MKLMVATRKFMFAGCVLEPDERFYARAPMAEALKKLRRAEEVTEEPAAPVYERRDMRAAVPVVAVSAIDDLRARYEAKHGKKADRRWKEARLRSEIAG